MKNSCLNPTQALFSLSSELSHLESCTVPVNNLCLRFSKFTDNTPEGPIVYPYTARYPSHRRIALWVGIAMCVSALLGASFTSDVSCCRTCFKHDLETQQYLVQVRILIALQGVLYGIGACKSCPYFQADPDFNKPHSPALCSVYFIYGRMVRSSPRPRQRYHFLR